MVTIVACVAISGVRSPFDVYLEAPHGPLPQTLISFIPSRILLSGTKVRFPYRYTKAFGNSLMTDFQKFSDSPVFTTLSIDLSSNEISGPREARDVPPPGGFCSTAQDSIQGASPLDFHRPVHILGVLSGMI